MKGLKTSIVNQEGEITGEKAVPTEIFGLQASPALISQAVKRFLSNQRKAQAKTKTRTQVHGSGAKIWRQKGTGRARHGDRQAPIFVGGGVAHGPTGEQNYKKKMNQKMIKKTLFAILTEKLESHQLFLLDEFKFKKTKEAFAFLQKLKKNLKIEGKVSFLLDKDPEIKRYLNNLEDVLILGVESLNPYSLLKTDFLFLTPQALKELEKTALLAKKENNESKS